jgi:uncharacterized protein (TIGR02217 family)
VAFHNVQLDPAISYGTDGGPTFATTVQRTASQHEYRITRSADAPRRYRFSKDLLSPDDWAGLLEFVYARRGNLHGFRFKDHRDFTTASDGVSAVASTDQIIGTGDDTETQFQLIKEYDRGGLNPFAQAITLPIASTLAVAFDGGSAGSYTLSDPGGIITFDTAPTAGVVITAGCEFDVPVRFDLRDEWLQLRLVEGYLANAIDIACVEVLDEVETPELWYPGGSSDLITTDQDYTINYHVKLWRFDPTDDIVVYLPPPDRIPGGDIFIIHVDSGASDTITVYDDAGNAVTGALAAGDTKRIALMRSSASTAWVSY